MKCAHKKLKKQLVAGQSWWQCLDCQQRFKAALNPPDQIKWWFDEREATVIDEIATKQELSRQAVLRQALRVYQLIFVGTHELKEVNPMPLSAAPSPVSESGGQPAQYRSICPTCDGPLNSCGHCKWNVYSVKLNDGSGMSQSVCWSCQRGSNSVTVAASQPSTPVTAEQFYEESDWQLEITIGSAPQQMKQILFKFAEAYAALRAQGRDKELDGSPVRRGNQNACE